MFGVAGSAQSSALPSTLQSWIPVLFTLSVTRKMLSIMNHQGSTEHSRSQLSPHPIRRAFSRRTSDRYW